MTAMSQAKPFVKWVGGKRKLVLELRARMPAAWGTYHEPFLGGGALFFDLAHAPSSLSDVNADLVSAYTALRDDVDGVIDFLGAWERDKDFYLNLRASDPAAFDPELRQAFTAARFIYLLKCGFNGLWRTNRAGKFNVPFGDNAGPVCDEETLRAASRALAGVEIALRDFAGIEPARGDFVYFDPPYVPLTATSNFTAYGAGGFDDADQVRLRDFALSLKGRGVHVLLSNSGADRVRELYAAFDVRDVLAARAINSKGDRRGKITEVLIS